MDFKSFTKDNALKGKYIQVTEGVTIGATSITLPTQANATYVVATTAMSGTQTVSAGWAQLNNSWYMVNANGDPQTGWQKDNTNQWVYLSTTNAVMETGWKLDGSTWYKLGDNGYMQTGWVNDGDAWYYCNSDGSMASKTTVNGYRLGSNGAWVR